MSQPTPFPIASVRPPGPFAKLRALIARLVNADGQSMETDLAIEFLAEGQAGMASAAESAQRTETLAERLDRHWRKATSRLSPGGRMITTEEQRILAADQRALARAAHSTTAEINALR